MHVCKLFNCRAWRYSEWIRCRSCMRTRQLVWRLDESFVTFNWAVYLVHSSSESSCFTDWRAAKWWLDERCESNRWQSAELHISAWKVCYDQSVVSDVQPTSCSHSVDSGVRLAVIRYKRQSSQLQRQVATCCKIRRRVIGSRRESTPTVNRRRAGQHAPARFVESGRRWTRGHSESRESAGAAEHHVWWSARLFNRQRPWQRHIHLETVVEWQWHGGTQRGIRLWAGDHPRWQGVSCITQGLFTAVLYLK